MVGEVARRTLGGAPVGAVDGGVMVAAAADEAGKVGKGAAGVGCDGAGGLGEEEGDGVALGLCVGVVARPGGDVADAFGAVEGPIAISAALRKAEDSRNGVLEGIAEGGKPPVGGGGCATVLQ